MAIWHKLDVGQVPNVGLFLSENNIPPGFDVETAHELIKRLVQIDLEQRIRNKEDLKQEWTKLPELAEFRDDIDKFTLRVANEFQPHLKKIGKYMIHDQPIGKGGQGIVVKGCHETMQHSVRAIKILRPDVLINLPATQRDAYLQRFQREASAMSQLSDKADNINVYDVNNDGPYQYIVYEFVEANNLEQHVSREGPQKRIWVATQGIRIARILKCAHEIEIVHRDIKPSNILYDKSEQRSYLIDFGMSKFQNIDVSEDQYVVGSLEWMPPEQANVLETLTPQTSIQSDVFSFGSTLYFMYTGLPPRDLSKATDINDALRIVRAGEIIGFDEIQIRRSEFSRDQDLESIINKCLKRDPSERFQNMEEAEFALTEYKLKLEESIERHGLKEKSLEFSAIVFILFAGLLGLTGAVIGAILGNTQFVTDNLPFARLGESIPFSYILDDYLAGQFASVIGCAIAGLLSGAYYARGKVCCSGDTFFEWTWFKAFSLALLAASIGFASFTGVLCNLSFFDMHFGAVIVPYIFTLLGGVALGYPRRATCGNVIWSLTMPLLCSVLLLIVLALSVGFLALIGFEWDGALDKLVWLEIPSIFICGLIGFSLAFTSVLEFQLSEFDNKISSTLATWCPTLVGSTIVLATYFFWCHYFGYQVADFDLKGIMPKIAVIEYSDNDRGNSIIWVGRKDQLKYEEIRVFSVTNDNLWQFDLKRTSELLSTVTAIESITSSPSKNRIAFSESNETMAMDGKGNKLSRTLGVVRAISDDGLLSNGLQFNSVDQDTRHSLKELHVWKYIGYGFELASCGEFNSDGSKFCVGYKSKDQNDSIAVAWDLADAERKPLVYLEHKEIVRAIGWSGDDSLIITVSEKRDWLNENEIPEGAIELTKNPESDTVLVHTGGAITFWDAGTGKQIAKEKFDFPCYSLDVDPSGRYAAVGHGAPLNAAKHYVPTGKVTIWDLQTNSLVHTFCCCYGDVYDVEFTGDGKQLVIASDGNLKILRMPQF